MGARSFIKCVKHEQIGPIIHIGHRTVNKIEIAQLAWASCAGARSRRLPLAPKQALTDFFDHDRVGQSQFKATHVVRARVGDTRRWRKGISKKTKSPAIKEPIVCGGCPSRCSANAKKITRVSYAT